MKVSAQSGDQGHVEVASPTQSAVAETAAIDIDVLYTEHAAFIGRVLVRLIGNTSHVDDLIQETFIIAFRKRDTFDGTSSARTWLYGIAARLAMRHRRGLGRWLRALGGMAQEPERISAGPEQDLDRARVAAVVHEVVARMPFKQREVFVLYELEELDGNAISALLGIPVNTVWTRLHHGRKRFEQAMRKRIRRDDLVA